MNFEQVIKKLREHYTCEEIAERVGVSTSAIYKLASGERRDTSYAVGAGLLELYEELDNG